MCLEMKGFPFVAAKFPQRAASGLFDSFAHRKVCSPKPRSDPVALHARSGINYIQATNPTPPNRVRVIDG